MQTENALTMLEERISETLSNQAHAENIQGMWRAQQESTLRGLLDTVQAAIEKIQANTPETLSLADNELPHLEVIWVWDDTRRVVVGPVCPKHRTAPLGYKPAHGDPIWANFEDAFISGSGRFICPVDKALFPSPMFEGLERVEHARTSLDERFRRMRGLDAKPKRPPTPEEQEALREAQESLRKYMQRKQQDPPAGA